MNEPYSSLSETLARIDELCAACGISPADELNVQDLVYNTGISAEDVQALLAGREVNDQGADARVRSRVTFLYETRMDLDNLPADISKIAAAIEATPVWTKRLVSGEAKPSIVTGHSLAKFYGVPAGFLTDSPADALTRELQSVVFDLEVRAEPEKKLKDLGVRHITGRSPGWSKDQLVEVAKMVQGIALDLQRVGNIVARMEEQEDHR